MWRPGGLPRLGKATCKPWCPADLDEVTAAGVAAADDLVTGAAAAVDALVTRAVAAGVATVVAAAGVVVVRP